VSIDSFARFASALCGTAGAAVPELKPDGDELAAFHLVLGDVVVDVVHPLFSDDDVDEAFVLVAFGPIAQDTRLEVLQAMAEANFSLMGSSAPVFGMNPESGDVVLRKPVDLARADPAQTYAGILRLAEFARQWRVDPTMGSFNASGAALAPGQLA
jgi:hypothetical protein